jgi:shikimate dehydrogenase
MQITGLTKVMLMFADPVRHVRGSVVLNTAFEELGLDAAIVPIHVLPPDLPALFAAVRLMQNVAGLGITIPHKINALALVDAATPAAQRVGAVNFIRREADGRLVGTNVDGTGFLAGLAANGVQVRGRHGLILGAGGVGRAIGFALADAGIASLRIANRDSGKARALAADIAAAVPSCAVSAVPASVDLRGVELLVNATSLGMHSGEALPIDPVGLAAGAVVAEVVVHPAMTPLLQAAQAAGHRVVQGVEMLKPQPRLVAEFFGLLPV